MKTVLKVLAAIVLFFALIIGIVFWATSGVTEAGDRFITALSSGDNDAAYELTSKAFKQSARPEQLAIFAKDYGLDRIGSTSWSSRSFENNSGELIGTATLDDGTEINLNIDLIYENDEWKVLHVSSKGAESGLSNAEADASTLAAPDFSQSQALVKRSMSDFAISVSARDMNHFRVSTSKIWQDQFDLQRFNDSYASIIEAGVDLAQLEPLTPLLAEAGELNDDSVLVLAGHYDSKPSKVHFEHKYVAEDGAWKLVGFNIEL